MKKILMLLVSFLTIVSDSACSDDNYRDETLAEIVHSTPDAAHLTGEGLTSGRITPSTIQAWIDLINEEWRTGYS